MNIRDRLLALQDKEYREFHSRLMPNIDPERIIGIRIPELRRLAKEIKGSREADEFIEELPHFYYEENNLHAFLIEQLQDYDLLTDELDRFLPFVDNWATCDSLRPVIFRKNTDRLQNDAFRWMASSHEYTVRFGIEVMMIHFLDVNFRKEYPLRISEIKSDKYYINMMLAWYFATALAKQWDAVIPFIENGLADTWVHNKTIQKAIESGRITPGQKKYLRALKRQ